MEISISKSKSKIYLKKILKAFLISFLVIFLLQFLNDRPNARTILDSRYNESDDPGYIEKYETLLDNSIYTDGYFKEVDKVYYEKYIELITKGDLGYYKVMYSHGGSWEESSIPKELDDKNNYSFYIQKHQLTVKQGKSFLAWCIMNVIAVFKDYLILIPLTLIISAGLIFIEAKNITFKVKE